MGIKMEKNQLHQKYETPKNAALSLGLRALSGPRKMFDNFLVKDDDGSFYANIPIEELIKYHEKSGEVEVAIAQRCLDTGINVGTNRALKLGLTYLERKQLLNCLWYEGLKPDKENEEKQKSVEKAVSEWADGENIIRHIGYGIDIFCTRDKAKKSGESILDAEHQEWLSEQYGVVFCTPSELVTKYLS
jgi:hypothetical protein